MPGRPMAGQQPLELLIEVRILAGSMGLDVEKVISDLLKSSYFEKAKEVREVSAGHTEDSVYTHCVETLEEARKSIDGNFITNPEAKKLFAKLMNTEIDGVPYRDLALDSCLNS